MPGFADHGRRGWFTPAATIVLVAAGVLGLRAQRHPPQPPAAAGIPFTATMPSPAAGRSGASSPAKRPAATGLLLARSVPTHLDIPVIGVSSELQQLGLNPDRSVEVPPLDRDSHAGWYKYSPTPGQLGPSVILGHGDSPRYGPGIFFRLGALRPGNTLTVTRADHTVAVFRVDRVVSYSKDQFPTLAVYGNTDRAALRLITCGGKFDLTSHNYESNIVAYATLIASHPA